MKKNILEHVVCNLCGDDNFTVIYPTQRGRKHDNIEKFHASGDERLIDQVVKCNRCGLIYVNPRLRPDLVIKGYTEGSDERFVSQADARERTFDKALNKIEKHAIVNSDGSKFLPGIPMINNSQKTAPIERIIHKGKILDVGTAGGSFLAAAKKRGWEVYGCEPNIWLANWGRKHYGINIDKGTLHEQHYASSSFDVVTLWDVIEHTPDPCAVFRECNRILKERGILVVNYPDIGSAIARLMGRRWVFLLSVHLYYFTPQTMAALLKKSGFEVIYKKPHIQKLQLGYLFTRASAYNLALSAVGKGTVRALGIDKKQIPYWLGQTFVIARKIKESPKNKLLNYPKIYK